MAKTPEQRIERLERLLEKKSARIKSLEQSVADLWDEVHNNEDARSAFEDETRDVAERARRLANRTSKKLNEAFDE